MNELLKATDEQLQKVGLVRVSNSEYWRIDQISTFCAWAGTDTEGAILHLQLGDGRQKEFTGPEAERIAAQLAAG
jgi:hypothetical protein